MAGERGLPVRQGQGASLLATSRGQSHVFGTHGGVICEFWKEESRAARSEGEDEVEDEDGIFIHSQTCRRPGARSGWSCGIFAHS